MKTCNKCKEAKDLASFYPDKSTEDKLRIECKACLKLYNPKDFEPKPKEDS